MDRLRRLIMARPTRPQWNTMARLARLALERPNQQVRITGITDPETVGQTYGDLTRANQPNWTATPNGLAEVRGMTAPDEIMTVEQIEQRGWRPYGRQTPVINEQPEQPEPPSRNVILMAQQLESHLGEMSQGLIRSVYQDLARQRLRGEPDQLWVHPARQPSLMQTLFPNGVGMEDILRPRFHNSRIFIHESIHEDEIVMINSLRGQLNPDDPDRLNMRIWGLAAIDHPGRLAETYWAQQPPPDPRMQRLTPEDIWGHQTTDWRMVLAPAAPPLIALGDGMIFQAPNTDDDDDSGEED